MKIRLPISLRAALLSVTTLAICASSGVSAKDYYWTGVGSSSLGGANWSETDGGTAMNPGMASWQVGGTNTIVFSETTANNSAVNKIVEQDFNSLQLAGIRVEAGATGFSLRGKGNTRSLYFGGEGTSGLGGTTLDIQENFTLGSSSASNNLFAISFLADTAIKVAAEKTLTIYAPLSGGSGKTLTLSAGGTVELKAAAKTDADSGKQTEPKNSGSTHLGQFSADWKVVNGALKVGNATALGTGAVNLSGASQGQSIVDFMGTAAGNKVNIGENNYGTILNATQYAGEINLANGATHSGDLTLGTGATLSVGTGAGASTAAIDGGLTLGTGSKIVLGYNGTRLDQLSLSGAFSGQTTISVTTSHFFKGGTYYLLMTTEGAIDANNFTLSGIATVGARQTFDLTNVGELGGAVTQNLYLSVTGDAQSLSWATGNGTWKLGGESSSSPWTGANDGNNAFYNNDIVTFAKNEGGEITLEGSLIPTAVKVSAAEGTYTFTGTGSIAGDTTTLEKSGEGTLVISNTNTYGGGTTIKAGTLSIVAGGTLGSGETLLTGGVLSFGVGEVALAGGVIVKGDATVSGEGGLVGDITLQSGSLTVGSTTALTNAGTKITFDGGTLKLGAGMATAALITSINAGNNMGKTISLDGNGNTVSWASLMTSSATTNLSILNSATGVTNIAFKVYELNELRLGENVVFTQVHNAAQGWTVNKLIGTSSSVLDLVSISGKAKNYRDVSQFVGTIQTGPASGESLDVQQTYLGLLSSNAKGNRFNLNLNHADDASADKFNLSNSGAEAVTFHIKNLSGNGAIGFKTMAGATSQLTSLDIEQTQDNTWTGTVQGVAGKTGAWTVGSASGSSHVFSINGVALASNLEGADLNIKNATVKFGGATSNWASKVNIAAEGTLEYANTADVERTAEMGVISGDGKLVKSGTSKVTLSTDNTYSGGTTVTDGTLVAGHVNALGRGEIVLNKGTLDAGGYALGNALTVNGGTIKNLKMGTEASPLYKEAVLSVKENIIVDNSFLQATAQNSVIIDLGKQVSLTNGAHVSLGASGASNVVSIALGGVNTGDLASSAITVATGTQLSFSGTLVLNMDVNSFTQATSGMEYSLSLLSLTEGNVDAYKGWASTNEGLNLADFEGFAFAAGTAPEWVLKSSTKEDIINELRNSGTVTVVYGASIPEPSTATLGILALAGLMFRRRRTV